jgi:predicted DNA-binding transcriptional regulator YafY
MSQKQIVKRHSKIINFLEKKPSSFKEIQNYLNETSQLDDDDFNISIRTFQRDIKDIASLYDIEICYNKKDKVYEIEEILQNQIKDLLFDSINLLDIIKLSKQHRDNILFENRQSIGSHHISTLLKAINDKNEIQLIHKNYWDLVPINRVIQPYLIKESKNRWYLIGLDKAKDEIRTFGLDRISSIQILKNHYEKPNTILLKENFNHSFGIIIGDNLPEKVLLEFSLFQANYIKSMPLHHSQKIIHEDTYKCIIELFIYPTQDFIMELLSFGSEVKVLEPEYLVSTLVETLEQTLSVYKNN